MKKIHYTDRYLLNPYHPVTVFVIGAGGTGSQVATGLARMSVALQALGHPGLHVTVFDPDTVTEANIGRQLFILERVLSVQVTMMFARAGSSRSAEAFSG